MNIILMIDCKPIILDRDLHSDIRWDLHLVNYTSYRYCINNMLSERVTAPCSYQAPDVHEN